MVRIATPSVSKKLEVKMDQREAWTHIKEETDLLPRHDRDPAKPMVKTDRVYARVEATHLC